MGDLPFGLIWELFGYSILAALFAGLFVPLVGSFLLVRRTGFYGVTLPQFAAAGIAFGFVALPWWQENMAWFLDAVALGDESHLALGYHVQWAGIFTMAGLIGMTLLSKKDGLEAGRVAASFAIASAMTILFAHASPIGEVYVHSLLMGEILAIDGHELGVLAGTLGAVALLLALFYRELTLASYDPDLAKVLGKNCRAWEALFMLLVGATVSVCVMSVGPAVLFGLLVIPPLVARPFARSMASFLILASLIGLLSAAAGVWASFTFDQPLGPTLVATAALFLPLGWLLKRVGAK
jgi:ABC-type Mn2+/Zn2+ transport system permease subunit